MRAGFAPRQLFEIVVFDRAVEAAKRLHQHVLARFAGKHLFAALKQRVITYEVAPFTGAWIETAASCAPTACRSGRPLHGGADRNALLCPVNASFEGLKAIPHRLPNWIRRPRDLGGIILEFGAATRENPDPAVIARLRSYPDLKRTTPEACARSVWHLGESPPGKAVMLPWPDGTTREYPPRPASQSSDRRSLPAEVCARRFALRPWAHDPLPAGQTPAPIRSHRDQAICSLSIF